MLASEVYDTVIFVLSCSVLLVTSLALLRDTRRSQLWSRFRRAAWRTAQALRSWGKAEHDEVNLLVQARLQEIKVEHFRWCCKCLCILVVVPNTLWMAWNIALGQQRSYTKMKDVAHIMFHAVLAWVICRPTDVSWRTIDFFYSASVMSMAVYISPPASGEELEATHIVAPTLIVAVLGVARRSLPLNLATAFLLSGLTYGTVTVHRGAVRNVPLVLEVQVLFQMCFAIGAQVLDASLGDTIRRGMEMKEARELIQAATALLRTACDAVVELHSEAIILSPADDLAGLLLRGPYHQLRNSSFTTVIAHEGDRERFMQKLSSPTLSGTEMAEAIHVHMRDVNRNTIRTQVMWFRFRRVDGQQRYMVGVREFSDMSAVGSLPPPPQPTAAADMDSNSDDGASVGASEASVDSLLTDEEHLAVVTVDSSDPDLLVLSCSPGFCMRVGRLAPGKSLRQCVRRGDGFIRWLQNEVGSVLTGGDRRQCHVTLMLNQRRVRATCRILVEAVEEGEEAVDVTSVRLLFFDVQQDCRPGGGIPSARPLLAGSSEGLQ